MQKQDFYRKLYKNINPNWNDSPSIYKDIIDKLINSKTYILDIGCGHANLLQDAYNKTKHTYGIDPDVVALKENTIIKNKVIGVVESLPFKDNYFDIVTLAWVLEHLKNPQKAFQEIYRVLKPGGKVIFITPNVWNYNVWIIRMIPNQFHAYLVKKLYGRNEKDTYPVYYKINSPKKIKKILNTIGFKQIKLILNGDPSYISFNKILFNIAITIEKLLDLRPFRSAKVHIIGIYQK